MAPATLTRASDRGSDRLPSGLTRLLVVRAGALGDTLMTTPLLRTLRQRYPRARIDYLCSMLARPLLEPSPHVDRVHALRWRNLPAALSWEKWWLARRLRRVGFQAVLLLESDRRYASLAERIAPGRVVYPQPHHRHPVHYAVHCLRCAGLPTDGRLDPEVHLTAEDEARAEELLAGLAGPLIGVHAGHGPRQRRRKRVQSERLKGWPSDRFARVSGALLERGGGSVVLTGSPEDLAEAHTIAAGLPGDRHRVLAGRTSVRELAAVIARLDLLVSVDSAPAHMAAAVGTPLLVLWGPAMLEQCEPLSSRSPVEVLRHPVWCAPCFGTPLKQLCRSNVCMQGITAEEVLEVAEGMLDRAKAAG